MAVCVEPVARYCKQLTVFGMQVLPSVSTGGWNAVVRQVRRCAAIQTPVNCQSQLEKHPVGAVEPVKFVVQYLTQTAVKSAEAFNTCCNLSVTLLGAPVAVINP